MIPLLPEALDALEGVGPSWSLTLRSCLRAALHIRTTSFDHWDEWRRRGGGGDAGALSLMGNFENMSGRRVKWMQSLGA